MSKTQGAEIVTFRVEYRFQLERVKKEKLDEVVANLNRQGKSIINITEGTIRHLPLGVVECSVTVIWELDTDDPRYKNYLKEEEEKHKKEIEWRNSPEGQEAQKANETALKVMTGVIIAVFVLWFFWVMTA